MADNKYYWLKLKRDFFKRHDIRIVEEMENGKDYVLFYLKMLLEGIDHEGELRFSETIPYNEKMLAVITNTNVDIVRSAMKVFIDLNMIDILEDSTIYMAAIERLIGKETAGAERVRNYRNKIKALQCNTIETKCNIEIEIEKEKEIDINKDINKQKTDKPTKHKYGEYNNVLLSDEEMDKLKSEFGDWEERIERLSSYIAQSGKTYKSHLATIRNWSRNEKSTPQSKEIEKGKYANYTNRTDIDYDKIEIEAMKKRINRSVRK